MEQNYKAIKLSYGFRWKILKPIAMESVDIYICSITSFQFTLLTWNRFANLLITSDITSTSYDFFGVMI